MEALGSEAELPSPHLSGPLGMRDLESVLLTTWALGSSGPSSFLCFGLEVAFMGRGLYDIVFHPLGEEA